MESSQQATHPLYHSVGQLLWYIQKSQGMNLLLENRRCQEALLFKGCDISESHKILPRIEAGLHEDSRSETAGRMGRKHEGRGYKVIELNFQNFLQQVDQR